MNADTKATILAALNTAEPYVYSLATREEYDEWSDMRDKALDAAGYCPICKGGKLLELRVQLDQKVLADCVCQQSIGDLAREIFHEGYKRAQQDSEHTALSVEAGQAGAWEPVPQSLEYDLITHAIKHGELEQGYSVCRQVTAPQVSEGLAVPTIVCLCGSTRFWRQFQVSGLEETLAGKIVLSIGSASGTDDEHFGHLSQEEHDLIIDQLNELHRRKIDMADEVLILNVGGYIGKHTQGELDYARKLGKKVRFLEDDATLQQRPDAGGE